MSRPLMTLALVTAFMLAGGFVPARHQLSAPSFAYQQPTAVGVMPASNITVIEKNQIWPVKVQGCQKLRCVAA
ncbi:MAG: hypothetical protein U1E46_15530 [Hyphomicrobiales bacterium]